MCIHKTYLHGIAAHELKASCKTLFDFIFPFHFNFNSNRFGCMSPPYWMYELISYILIFIISFIRCRFSLAILMSNVLLFRSVYGVCCLRPLKLGFSALFCSSMATIFVHLLSLQKRQIKSISKQWSMFTMVDVPAGSYFGSHFQIYFEFTSYLLVGEYKPHTPYIL